MLVDLNRTIMLIRSFHNYETNRGNESGPNIFVVDLNHMVAVLWSIQPESYDYAENNF